MSAHADCGDGRVEPDEVCDLGDGNGPTGSCSSECAPHRCGDGLIAAVESCDDGNDRDGDGCDRSCRAEHHPIWSETFDAAGVRGDFFNAVAYHDGRLFAVGGALDRAGAVRPFIASWDASGDFPWAYLPEGEPGLVTYEDVVVTHNGTVVVVGSRREPARSRWIGAFDSEGNRSLDRTIEPELVGEILTVALTPDNQLIVGGWTDDILRDPWLAQINPYTFEIAWERHLDKPGRGSYFADIAINDEGSIATSGSLRASTFTGERWVALFSADGTMKWEVSDMGVANLAAHANAVAFGDGESVYAGGSQRLTDWDDEATRQQFDYDGWVSRFDDGVEVWTRRERGAGLGIDEIEALAVNERGMLIALGSVQSQPLLMQTDDDYDALLVSYDPDGERLWKTEFDGPLHVTDLGSALVLGDADEVYVAGTTATAFEGENAWLAEFSLPVDPDPTAVDRQQAAPAVGPAVPATIAPAEPDEIETAAGTLYLNFLGGDLSPGHAADLGQAACIDAPLSFPGLPIDRAFAAEVARIVEHGLSEFAVTVVWEEPPPAHLPYTMLMIGGEAPQIGLPEGTAGYACDLDCFDREKRDIAFVFGGGEARNVAINVLHEAAHTWGLDHLESSTDVMSPFTHGASPQWGDECIPVSEVTSKAHCGEVHQKFCSRPGEQNSRAEMLALFGAREDDDEPPTARVVRPLEGEVFAMGEAVAVEVDVHDNLGNVGWKIEVPSLGISEIARGDSSPISLTLPGGPRELRLVATDHQGNETVVYRSVQIGDPRRETNPATDPQQNDDASRPASAGDDNAEDDGGRSPEDASAAGGCSVPVAPRPWATLFLLASLACVQRRR